MVVQDIKKFLCFILIMVSSSVYGDGVIADPVDLTVTDYNGVSYNFDELLDAGKHIVIHQASSG